MSQPNELASIEGQLVGMPLAGPESFSQQQLDYLKRALGVDETVLWEGSIGTNSSATLSEPYTNFERIRISGICSYSAASNEGYSADILSQSLHELTLRTVTMNSTADADGTYNIIAFMPCLFNGTTVTTKNGRFMGYWGSAWKYQINNTFTLKRIVGIHRIAGGN